MLRVNNLTGFGSSRLPARSEFYIGSSTLTGNSVGTYNFPSVNLGTPDPNRYIIVGFGTDNRLDSTVHTISGVTIGGIAATPITNTGFGGTRSSSLWMANVPTGTTGDIVVTHSGFLTYCTCHVWHAIGVEVHDFFSSQVAPTATGTIDCPAGGFIVGVCRMSHVSNDISWTGITEVYDATSDGVIKNSSAWEQFLTTQTGLTVSATQTSNTASRLSVASFNFTG